MTGETTAPPGMVPSSASSQVEAPSEALSGAATSAAAERACPKCRRERQGDEQACARCGLLVSHFGQFGRPEVGGDPLALESAWRGCLDEWASAAAHDRALAAALSHQCLPALARRYREHAESTPDAIAERRLQQIAVLIETAIHSQVQRVTSSPLARAVWILGYAMAGALLLASAWVCLLALRHHG